MMQRLPLSQRKTSWVSTPPPYQWWRCAACLVVLTLLSIAPRRSDAFDSTPDAPAEDASSASNLLDDPRAFQGYTLIAPMVSNKSYLIDMQGSVVRSWKSTAPPGASCYLLPNGNLLRPARVDADKHAFGDVSGAGGTLEEYTWEGELVWSYTLCNEKQLAHHDVARLPNGNTLMILWEKKTVEEAIAAGRDPEKVSKERGLYASAIFEIKPTGPDSGEVVWEWRAWDHVIQDFDSSKANYGKVEEHPELIDINFDKLGEDRVSPESIAALRAIGYLSNKVFENPQGRLHIDWLHNNSIAYNPELDQIIISPHNFSEVWIIDHSTTTEEARGHTGGRQQKGGDLLYRWENSQTYRRGTADDQQLFMQHSPYWIPPGLDGAGQVLIFNNGTNRPELPYSSVEQIDTGVRSDGSYALNANGRFGPEAPAWQYTSPNNRDFFGPFVSGAERMPNGNTLISGGPNGSIFEVTPDGEIVWRFMNPVIGVLNAESSIEDASDPLLQARISPNFNFNQLFRQRFGHTSISGRIDTRVFRVCRYGPDYPGLQGRDLTPGPTIEEEQWNEWKAAQATSH